MTYADLVQRTRNRVLAALNETGITKALIARRAGVHRNTLDGVSSANWNPTGETVDALNVALDRLEK